MTNFRRAMNAYNAIKFDGDALSRRIRSDHYFGYMMGLIDASLPQVGDRTEYFVQHMINENTDPFEFGLEESLLDYEEWAEKNSHLF